MTVGLRSGGCSRRGGPALGAAAGAAGRGAAVAASLGSEVDSAPV
ncbi:MAG: hypothetical protein WDM84_09035 [Bauldia sp.]